MMKPIRQITNEFDLPKVEPKKVILGFSDVHGNLEAFNEFKRHIDNYKSQAPISIIGLGDYVDYGPDSVKVLYELEELQTKYSATLFAGNHDVMIKELVNDIFGKDLKSNSISYHFKRLKGVRGRISAMLVAEQIQKDQKALEILNLLMKENLSAVMALDDTIIGGVHGSVKNPLWGDLVEDFKNNDAKIFTTNKESQVIVLCGHTHKPEILQNANGVCVMNVGSIGQPRDNSPFGSFAIIYEYENEICVQIKRFAYDYKTTIEKIHTTMPQQHPFYGERLITGK